MTYPPEKLKDWGPTDEVRAEANDALELFTATGSDVRAIDAIEKFIDAGLPIPKELKPYMLEAVCAWREEKGNRQRVKTELTAHKWSLAVYCTYKRWLGGMTVVDAAKSVAATECANKNVKAETLFDEYRKGKYKYLKLIVKVDLLKEYVALVKNGNTDLMEQFRSKWPRLVEKHLKSKVV